MILSELLYPKRCPVCLDPLFPGETLICPECKEKLRLVRQPVCYLCGKPLSDGSREYCHNCEKRKPSFEKGLSWAEYTSFYVRRMMGEAKYRGNCQILDYPCLDLVNRHKNEILSWHANALVPVPVHEEKRLVRGYNQAAEIAYRLSSHLSIPVDEGALVRTENTKAQKDLSEQLRFENLLRAFQVPDHSVIHDTVILVDDIYTTGSTAECCTRALLSSGVRKVYVLTLSIGRDF